MKTVQMRIEEHVDEFVGNLQRLIPEDSSTFSSVFDNVHMSLRRLRIDTDVTARSVQSVKDGMNMRDTRHSVI